MDKYKGQVTHIETNMDHVYIYRMICEKGWDYELIVPKGHQIICTLNPFDKQTAKKAQREITPDSLFDYVWKDSSALILNQDSLAIDGEVKNSRLRDYVDVVLESNYQGRLIVSFFKKNIKVVENSLDGVDMNKVTLLSKPHSLAELLGVLR